MTMVIYETPRNGEAFTRIDAGKYYPMFTLQVLDPQVGDVLGITTQGQCNNEMTGLFKPNCLLSARVLASPVALRTPWLFAAPMPGELIIDEAGRNISADNHHDYFVKSKFVEIKVAAPELWITTVIKTNELSYSKKWLEVEKGNGFLQVVKFR